MEKWKDKYDGNKTLAGKYGCSKMKKRKN